MKKKLLFSLLSLTALSFSALSITSCGGSSSYDLENFLPTGTSDNPYQIVKDPVTIKVFAPHSSGNPEYKDLKMFKYLSKITNLNFDFTTPDTSAYSARRASVWQDSNYKPDLFLFNNPIAEQVQYAEKNFNAFVPFNKDYSDSTGNVGNLIENYMPNYKKLMADNFNIDKNVESASDAATINDGTMYCTLSTKDVARDLTYKMFINNVWVKNCYDNYSSSFAKKNGIDDASKITTIEQYVGILNDFKNYDVNMNGSTDDEIGVSSKAFEYLRNFILESYGYVSYSCELENDGSKFTYVPLTQAYRNYLKTANGIWKSGLMDSSTLENKTDSQMAANGSKTGSFVAAAPYLIAGGRSGKDNKDFDPYNTYLDKDNNTKNYRYDEEYTTIGPLLSSAYNGAKKHLGFGYFSPDGTCIPTTTVYAREVARLIDIMYSDLGTQLISYGVEGEDWNWDDNTKTSWTFNVPSTWSGTQEDYRGTITPNVGSASALYWSSEFVEKMNDDVITTLNKQSSIYTPYLKDPEPSKYKFNSSEYEEISTIKAQLDSQIEYYEASFITNTLDPNDDAKWNEYVSAVKRFNGEKLETIYNTMLARYK